MILRAMINRQRRTGASAAIHQGGWEESRGESKNGVRENPQGEMSNRFNFGVGRNFSPSILGFRASRNLTWPALNGAVFETITRCGELENAGGLC